MPEYFYGNYLFANSLVNNIIITRGGAFGIVKFIEFIYVRLIQDVDLTVNN